MTEENKLQPSVDQRATMYLRYWGSSEVRRQARWLGNGRLLGPGARLPGCICGKRGRKAVTSMCPVHKCVGQCEAHCPHPLLDLVNYQPKNCRRLRWLPRRHPPIWKRIAYALKSDSKSKPQAKKPASDSPTPTFPSPYPPSSPSLNPADKNNNSNSTGNTNNQPSNPQPALNVPPKRPPSPANSANSKEPSVLEGLANSAAKFLVSAAVAHVASNAVGPKSRSVSPAAGASRSMSAQGMPSNTPFEPYKESDFHYPAEGSRSPTPLLQHPSDPGFNEFGLYTRSFLQGGNKVLNEVQPRVASAPEPVFSPTLQRIVTQSPMDGTRSTSGPLQGQKNYEEPGPSNQHLSDYPSVGIGHPGTPPVYMKGIPQEEHIPERDFNDNMTIHEQEKHQHVEGKVTFNTARAENSLAYRNDEFEIERERSRKKSSRSRSKSLKNESFNILDSPARNIVRAVSISEDASVQVEFPDHQIESPNFKIKRKSERKTREKTTTTQTETRKAETQAAQMTQTTEQKNQEAFKEVQQKLNEPVTVNTVNSDELTSKLITLKNQCAGNEFVIQIPTKNDASGNITIIMNQPAAPPINILPIVVKDISNGGIKAASVISNHREPQSSKGKSTRPSKANSSIRELKAMATQTSPNKKETINKQNFRSETVTQTVYNQVEASHTQHETSTVKQTTQAYHSPRESTNTRSSRSVPLTKSALESGRRREQTNPSDQTRNAIILDDRETDREFNEDSESSFGNLRPTLQSRFEEQWDPMRHVQQDHRPRVMSQKEYMREEETNTHWTEQSYVHGEGSYPPPDPQLLNSNFYPIRNEDNSGLLPSGDSAKPFTPPPRVAPEYIVSYPTHSNSLDGRSDEDNIRYPYQSQFYTGSDASSAITVHADDASVRSHNTSIPAWDIMVNEMQQRDFVYQTSQPSELDVSDLLDTLPAPQQTDTRRVPYQMQRNPSASSLRAEKRPGDSSQDRDATPRIPGTFPTHSRHSSLSEERIRAQYGITDFNDNNSYEPEASVRRQSGFSDMPPYLTYSACSDFKPLAEQLDAHNRRVDLQSCFDPYQQYNEHNSLHASQSSIGSSQFSPQSSAIRRMRSPSHVLSDSARSININSDSGMGDDMKGKSAQEAKAHLRAAINVFIEKPMGPNSSDQANELRQKTMSVASELRVHHFEVIDPNEKRYGYKGIALSVYYIDGTELGLAYVSLGVPVGGVLERICDILRINQKMFFVRSPITDEGSLRYDHASSVEQEGFVASPAFYLYPKPRSRGSEPISQISEILSISIRSRSACSQVSSDRSSTAKSIENATIRCIIDMSDLLGDTYSRYIECSAHLNNTFGDIERALIKHLYKTDNRFARVLKLEEGSPLTIKEKKLLQASGKAVSRTKLLKSRKGRVGWLFSGDLRLDSERVLGSWNSNWDPIRVPTFKFRGWYWDRVDERLRASVESWNPVQGWGR